ncbi:MAG: hypothetical protein NC916_02275 [Candidatus Omnitrophica bacterium]|nr:hypothetical protein [Candidatus Omnitrophota bacterium]
MRIAGNGGWVAEKTKDGKPNAFIGVDLGTVLEREPSLFLLGFFILGWYNISL